MIPLLFLFGQSQADHTTPKGPAEQLDKTRMQRNAYDNLRDPYVLHLRKALNGYLDGINVGINSTGFIIRCEGRNPSGLDCFSKEYFRSKFVVVRVSKALGGGKLVSIIFQDKPDKLFVGWVYKYSGNMGFDLRGFWQSSGYDKEVMAEIRKNNNISQIPSL